jgi:DNA-binding protein WhiA
MMIHKVKNTPWFAKQSDKFKFFCSIRLMHPESSFKDITDIFINKYKIKITRGGINHFIIKIRNFYQTVK